MRKNNNFIKIKLLKARMATFHGVISLQEVWGDHQIDSLRNQLSNPGYFGISEDAIKARLRFYERFPPSVPHDRVFGHIVNVYRVVNPFFKCQGSLMIPQRDLADRSSQLELLAECDVSKTILPVWQACDGPDGRKITVPHEDLDIQVTAWSERIAAYACSPKKPIPSGEVTTHHILKYTTEFHVLYFMAVDDQRLKQSTSVYHPAYVKKDNGFLEFRRFVCSKE